MIATDINPKAINYAHFNAILNGVEEKMDFRVGDLFAPVKGMKFDLIIWNGTNSGNPKNAREVSSIFIWGNGWNRVYP